MNLYNILNELNIKYDEVEHKPVFTVEQAQFVKSKIKGIGCKNLLLTNNKNKYYLVILKENKKADIKYISKLVNEKHLSFASLDELKNILNLTQGSVTPFGIIYDKNNLVTLLIDKQLEGKKLLFHPNINTKTISIKYNNLIKFIEYEHHIYIVI